MMCGISINSRLCFLIALLNLSTVLYIGDGREFKVGGDLGWLEPSSPLNISFFNLWASSHRFHIGDSLVFKYNNDSVIVVEKWGYYHCDASRPIMAFDNGNSTVKLDRAGPFYFISGTTDHCKHGHRMIVQVMTSPRALPPATESPSPNDHDHDHDHDQTSAGPPSSISLASALLLFPLVVFAEHFV